jgi:hypothetical protein
MYSLLIVLTFKVDSIPRSSLVLAKRDGLVARKL